MQMTRTTQVPCWTSSLRHTGALTCPCMDSFGVKLECLLQAFMSSLERDTCKMAATTGGRAFLA